MSSVVNVMLVVDLKIFTSLLFLHHLRLNNFCVLHCWFIYGIYALASNKSFWSRLFLSIKNLMKISLTTKSETKLITKFKIYCVRFILQSC